MKASTLSQIICAQERDSFGYAAEPFQIVLHYCYAFSFVAAK